MDNKLLNVVFSTDSRNERTPEPGQVVIYVDRDYLEKNRTFRFHCRLSEGRAEVGGVLYLGLMPASILEDKAKERAYNNSELLFEGLFESIERERTRFFTMLPDMEEYRKIVRLCGPKKAQLLLTSINDMVIHKSMNTDWFDEALESDTFQLRFLLKSGSFYAFHNAESIFSGLINEDISGISKSISLEYQLDGFKNKHKINLKYESDSLIPKRINILIGKNGVGKSQALTKFSRLALQMTNEEGTLKDTESMDGRPMINRMIAIGTPGETVNTFPGERVNQQKIFYRRLSFTRGSRSKQSRGITEALIQLGRNEESIKGKSRWSFFWDAISTCLPVKKIGILNKNKELIPLSSFASLDESESTAHFNKEFDRNSEPKFCGGESINPLSSGQLTFFKFALQCSLYIENGSFVLMDEPETHLHPNMISDFVEMLDSLLEATGSQALIATHSAYFVREVSRDQVHVFQVNQDNMIDIVPPRLRTFGSDIDSISQFVFAEDIDSRLTSKILRNLGNKKFDEVAGVLEKELSLSALMDLQSRML